MKQEILRKLIHLSSLWMVVFIAIIDKKISIIFFSCLLLTFAVFEFSRMHFQRFGQWLTQHFSIVMRDHEKTNGFQISALTGSFYFIFAVLCSVILFDKSIAIAAVMVMIISDTVAALVGKSLGRHRILDKTIEGTIGFFLSTFVIIFCFNFNLHYLSIAMISIVIACIELISNKIHINDNLSITMGAGFLLTLLTSI